MKIGITGHTKGIGKTLFESLCDEKREIFGYSRSNGWDITKDIKRIYEDAREHDLFINNAQSQYYQAQLHSYFYREGYEGRMISIGSMGSEYNLQFKNHPYAIQKVALAETNSQLYMMGYNVSLINLAYVDTENTRQMAERMKHGALHMAQARMRYSAINPAKPLPQSTVYDLVQFILDFPYRVKSITVST